MSQYIGIHSEGGLIPYDVLDKIAKEELGLGQQPKDFGLPAGRRLTDEIARAWSDALDYWHIFQRRSASLPESETGATLARKWIADALELLGYELALQQAGVVIGGKNYPISHRAGASEEAAPVQIEGFRTDLDKRPQARRLSPQALVQEYLNNSDAQLWGIVTNGYLLRLLRDTSRTSRPSYLEFDLQSILEGNRFNEFAILYRVCHRTRLPRTAEEATSCWLERYSQLSIEQGGRVRDKLRDGVEEALRTLGTGFLRHPENSALRERAKAGTLTASEFHRQLLRLVYRLLFLMVAEERRMIVPEGPEADRRQSLFDRYYSVGRLRTLAEKPIEPSVFGDLWVGLQQTFNLFEDGDSNPLGIPPLNGDLFSAVAVKDLQDTHLYNDVLLAAMQRLSLFEDHRVRQRVNYSALDVEELGSVYESLLDFHPAFNDQPEGLSFELRTGSERKSTGSYYTRPELVRELIESALVPVMQDRLGGAKDSDPAKEKEKKQQAILSMSVCDPACGSGHFLLAAARRLGRELAKIKTGEDEPTPKEFHLAVRDVIAQCVYGVDVNPLAVDLCKLALWLEGHWTGKPLSFLDHRIKLGNSLIGMVDMNVLKAGIPDDAYTPVAGDDKKVASAFKKRNRDERKGQPSLPFDAVEHVHQYAQESEQFGSITEDTPADVRRKKESYEKARQKPDWWHDWVAANLWTAAFFLPLTKYDDPVVPTHDKFIAFLRGNHVDAQIEGAAIGLATELRFFHWPLEFPDVFERGGFDVVIGNPPWEMLQLDPQEFFLTEAPEIAAAPNMTTRERKIASLEEKRPALFQRYLREKHLMDDTQKFVHSGGRFPLTSYGRINLMALFAELSTKIISRQGRTGNLVPTGIATDNFNQFFFVDLISRELLVSLYDFENREQLFPSVDTRMRFCLLTTSGGRTNNRKFAFFCTNPGQLRDERRTFNLTIDDFALVNPNTKTCPTFRTAADAALTRKLYRAVPVLRNESADDDPWGFKGILMFMMNAEFKTSADVSSAPPTDYLPLYEGKMIQAYDHRAASIVVNDRNVDRQGQPNPTMPDQHRDPMFAPSNRYWVGKSEVDLRLGSWTRRWMIAYKDVTSATNERTSIFAVIPRVGAGDSLPIVLLTKASPRQAACFLANANSIVFDYIARQKVAGNHLRFGQFQQLPMFAPNAYLETDIEFIVTRVSRLVFTSFDMKDFASDLEISSEPFFWGETERAQMRAELDAYFAHLNMLTREELRYILDPKDVFGPDFPSETFRVLKKNEEKEYGEYRTRRLVLEAFDQLAESPRFHDEMSKRKSALNPPEKTLTSVGK